MVDFSKRNALKAIGGVAAIVSVPAISSANSGRYNPQPDSDEPHVNEIIVPTNTGAELSVDLSVHPVPTITLTNHSDQQIVVKHVYPGIIHAGAQAFDINSIFVNGAYEIKAGEARTLNIQPTTSVQAEARFSREIYRNKPQRIIKVTGNDRNGLIVNSTRSFFA